MRGFVDVDAGDDVAVFENGSRFSRFRSGSRGFGIDSVVDEGRRVFPSAC